MQRTRAALGASAVVLGSIVLGSTPAHSSPATPSEMAQTGLHDVSAAVIPIYSYRLINVTTWQNWVDFSRPIASCTTAVTGGTCTLSQTSTIGTTIQTSLGYSYSGVAASLGFSLSRQSATTASCTSPALPAGQRFTMYVEGTEKQYQIQKWGTTSAVNAPPPHLIATSGYLSSWQPYNYPAIYCTL